MVHVNIYSLHNSSRIMYIYINSNFWFKLHTVAKTSEFVIQNMSKGYGKRNADTSYVCHEPNEPNV